MDSDNTNYSYRVIDNKKYVIESDYLILQMRLAHKDSDIRCAESYGQQMQVKMQDQMEKNQQLKAQNAQLYADKEDARRVANELQREVELLRAERDTYAAHVADWNYAYIQSGLSSDEMDKCFSLIQPLSRVRKIKADAVRGFVNETILTGRIQEAAHIYIAKLERGDV